VLNLLRGGGDRAAQVQQAMHTTLANLKREGEPPSPTRAAAYPRSATKWTALEVRRGGHGFRPGPGRPWR
jgi:hypothetical protein